MAQNARFDGLQSPTRSYPGANWKYSVRSPASTRFPICCMLRRTPHDALVFQRILPLNLAQETVMSDFGPRLRKRTGNASDREVALAAIQEQRLCAQWALLSSFCCSFTSLRCLIIGMWLDGKRGGSPGKHTRLRRMREFDRPPRQRSQRGCRHDGVAGCGSRPSVLRAW